MCTLGKKCGLGRGLFERHDITKLIFSCNIIMTSYHLKRYLDFTETFVKTGRLISLLTDYHTFIKNVLQSFFSSRLKIK